MSYVHKHIRAGLVNTYESISHVLVTLSRMYDRAAYRSGNPAPHFPVDKSLAPLYSGRVNYLRCRVAQLAVNFEMGTASRNDMFFSGTLPELAEHSKQ